MKTILAVALVFFLPRVGFADCLKASLKSGKVSLSQVASKRGVCPSGAIDLNSAVTTKVGPVGPKGETGPPGAGFTGVVVGLGSLGLNVPALGTADFGATCPGGKAVLGAVCLSTEAQIVASGLRYFPGGATCSYSNPTHTQLFSGVTVKVLCADIP